MLAGCRLLQEVDSWCWRPEGNVGFTIKSTYKILERLLVLKDNLGDIEKHVFDYLWKNSAPSKAVDFSWKVLLDGISTKTNLVNVLPT